MRHRALLVALVLLAVATPGAVTTPAGAGEPSYLGSIEASCEIGGGGDYLVVVRITNLLDVETQVIDGQFAFVTGSSTISSGTTVFVPNPVAPGTTTVAQITGPGDSVHVEVGFSIVALQLDDTVSLELDGNCVEPATTSSTAPTSTSTATTVAVAAQPRFTG